MRRPRALPKAKRSEASQVLELEPVVRPWPKGKRCACLFTFDLDADVVWVHRGSDDPIALSMGRYESKVGVPLLLNLLDDYGIKSTFFVPGWVAEQYTPTIEDILRRGHDIEHHGYLHEPPRTFKSKDEEEQALVKGIEKSRQDNRASSPRLSLAVLGVQRQHDSAAREARI